MKIEIECSLEGGLPEDPKECVLLVEAATRAICQATGKDPAEGIMMLLTAAAHVHHVHSRKSYRDLAPGLATSLGHAVAAAEGFFTPREVAAANANEKDGTP